MSGNHRRRTHNRRRKWLSAEAQEKPQEKPKSAEPEASNAEEGKKKI